LVLERSVNKSEAEGKERLASEIAIVCHVFDRSSRVQAIVVDRHLPDLDGEKCSFLRGPWGLAQDEAEAAVQKSTDEARTAAIEEAVQAENG
jgi:hypothetical protein